MYHVALNGKGEGQIFKSENGCVVCHLSFEFAHISEMANRELKKYDRLQGVVREEFRRERYIAFEKACKRLRDTAEAMTIREDVKLQQELMQKSVSVEELIVHLQKLKPGTRVVMQQTGHYADGSVFNFNMRDLVDINGVQYHSLGVSEQFC